MLNVPRPVGRGLQHDGKNGRCQAYLAHSFQFLIWSAKAAVFPDSKYVTAGRV